MSSTLCDAKEKGAKLRQEELARRVETPIVDQSPKAQPQHQYTSFREPGLHVPQFWPNNPKMWFTEVEQQFATNNVTQDYVKYNIIVAQLDKTYIIHLQDIIDNPPLTKRYDRLKSALITRFVSLGEDMLRHQLSKEALGDKLPSEFLKHLRTLAGKKHNSDSFLRNIWVNAFHTNIKKILNSDIASSLSLDKIAKVMDPYYGTVTQPQPARDAKEKMFHDEIKKLIQETATLTVNGQELSTSFSPDLPPLHQPPFRHRFPWNRMRVRERSLLHKDPEVLGYLNNIQRHTIRQQNNNRESRPYHNRYRNNLWKRSHPYSVRPNHQASG